MNLRRLALVSGFAVLSALAFSPKAQAQNANVDFSGEIGPACIINSTENGRLEKNLSGTSLNTILPGNINVSCTDGTTFTITSITDNGTVLSTGTYTENIDFITARVLDGGIPVVNGDLSPNGVGSNFIINPIGTVSELQLGPITDKDYAVELAVTNTFSGIALNSGYYKIRVNVALAPQ